MIQTIQNCLCSTMRAVLEVLPPPNGPSSLVSISLMDSKSFGGVQYAGMEQRVSFDASASSTGVWSGSISHGNETTNEQNSIAVQYNTKSVASLASQQLANFKLLLHVEVIHIFVFWNRGQHCGGNT